MTLVFLTRQTLGCLYALLKHRGLIGSEFRCLVQQIPLPGAAACDHVQHGVHDSLHSCPQVLPRLTDGRVVCLHWLCCQYCGGTDCTERHQLVSAALLCVLCRHPLSVQLSVARVVVNAYVGCAAFLCFICALSMAV